MNPLMEVILFVIQALEAQQKRLEALEELQKICLILRIFPPEENSVSFYSTGFVALTSHMTELFF